MCVCVCVCVCMCVLFLSNKFMNMPSPNGSLIP